MQERKGGIYKIRSVKDALDILTMSYGDPFIFTYSSAFGALALQLKQTRDNFCSNWASLDWGKREWPPIGTIGEGGVRGVRFDSPHASRICNVNCTICKSIKQARCEVFLTKSISSRKSQANIRNLCKCR